MNRKHIDNYLDFFDLTEHDIFLCEVCGSNQMIDFHHIIKRSNHGDDTVENIIACCRSCHNKAHHREKPHLNQEYLQGVHDRRMKNHLK